MSEKDAGNPVMGVEFTVDWLTVTVRGQKRRNELLEELFHVKQLLTQQGEKENPWFFKGYKGWQQGQFFYGRRDEDDIVSVSGATAHEFYLKLISYATNVTRIDLAATVKFKWDDIGLASRHYDTIKEMAEHLPIIRKYSLITNLLGGDTLYIGAPTSDQRGRIYDKMRQKNYQEFLHCWRYEVQFRRQHAMQVIAELVASASPEHYIRNKVIDWFSTRLIDMPLEPQGTYNAIGIQRRKTTDEKALQWLAKMVRPTIERLVERRGLDEVLVTLGLPLIDEREG